MKNYGVLKGSVINYVRDNDNSPHSELLLQANGVDYRIAINVRSSRGPVHRRLIEHLIVHDFQHPTLDHARELPIGWNDLRDGVDDEAALDYIRSNMFRATDMKPVVHMEPGPNNDLFEYIEGLIDRAIREDDATVYAFGERWGPEDDKEDKYFDFLPGNGVHMIHMNQGDPSDNHGTYRDGALFIDFPSSNQSVALFLKFQNQVWHTDDQDATPMSGAPSVVHVEIPSHGDAPSWPVVSPDSPYHLARIVAAMVNPFAEDEGNEFVTVLNISEEPLDLSGWKVLDRNDNFDDVPDAVVQPGETAVIRLSGEGAQLSNKGGTITLLDARGFKVDGVAYTKKDASRRGRPVVFV
ncbi:DUF2278 family protein [Photobacterium sp. 53610]|uniref:DUF2278 family protein n=1 Tax=Photobacterium sp. 53610 TaxID=3102789 RepID=UPI002ED9C923